jgi:MoxR-like ATPase
MSYRAVIALVVILGTSLSCVVVRAEQTEVITECEAAFTTDVKDPLKFAAESFNNFFTGIRTQLFERDFFLNVSRLALLSKEHVLMIGPPGNAKSMGVDLIIDNIVDEKTGENSVYKIQMTPETSLSETHGVIDYKKIVEENVQTRKWEQGLLSARLAFIDEFFDARANAIRNNLMALNEREHAQGRERIKGVTETGFAASNKYINEVYEKAGDDGPKAIIDRFAFATFVPGDLEDLNSAMRLIQESAIKNPVRMTFQQLDLLRAKVNEVKIPDYVARMLTLIFTRMKTQTETMEQSEKKRYLEQRKSGLNPLPPYRSTKYYSARTLRKAGKILRAIVVNDWINKEGERSLVANSLDLEKMVEFFALGSYNDEFLAHLEESTVNPYEKIQVMTVLKERAMFRDIYEEMMNQVNSRTAILTELEMEKEAAVTPELKQVLVERMITHMLETVVTGANDGRIREMTEESIANQYIRETLEDSLREMLGEEYDKTVATQVKAIQEEHQRKVLEAQQQEQERIRLEREEVRRREIAARRLQELKSLFNDAHKVKQVLHTGPSGRGGYAHFSISPLDRDRWQMFYLANNQVHYRQLNLKEPSKMTDDEIWGTIDSPDQVLKITALEERKFLLWFGMYGRVFEKSSLSKSKLIYETHGNQTISDNSSHDQFWVIDRQDYKVGVVDNQKLGSIDWVDLKEFAFMNKTAESRYSLQYMMADLNNNSARVLLTGDKGIAHVFAAQSQFGYPIFYTINLNEKRIEVIEDFNMPNLFVNISSLISTQLSSSRETVITMDGIIGDKYPAEIRAFDVDGIRPPLTVRGQVPSDMFVAFQSRIFDMSPDGTYCVTVTPDRQAILGLDITSGEQFPIAMPAQIGQILRIQFIDQTHLLLQALDAWSVLELPGVAQ